MQPSYTYEQLLICLDKEGMMMATEQSSLIESAEEILTDVCRQSDDCPCGCNREITKEQFATLPDEELLYDLADLFKVFADTTRIKILYSLMGTDLSVGQIADVVGATQSAVSHQLRVLKQAHLVKFQRDGKSVIYSLSDDHVNTMLAQGMTHICE